MIMPLGGLILSCDRRRFFYYARNLSSNFDAMIADKRRIASGDFSREVIDRLETNVRKSVDAAVGWAQSCCMHLPMVSRG
jgi:hypothetical protein